MASLWPEMNHRRLGSSLVVALALFAVLGHICVLPFHAHAGAITMHEEHPSPQSGGHPDQEAAHAGSCEVLKSALLALDGVVLAPLGTVAVVTSESPRRGVDADSAIVLGSPPLFLLHAALLI